MRTSTVQDREFIEWMFSSSLLEDSISYIVREFSAEDLYGREVLEEWAEENNYIKVEE